MVPGVNQRKGDQMWPLVELSFFAFEVGWVEDQMVRRSEEHLRRYHISLASTHVSNDVRTFQIMYGLRIGLSTTNMEL